MRSVIFDPGSPDIPCDSMHPLAERAFEIMESAEIAQELIDEICNGINALAGQANIECPECERRATQEEQRTWDIAEYKQRAEAAEAKLRDLEMQEPVGEVNVVDKTSTGVIFAAYCNVSLSNSNGPLKLGQKLYAKPFPAPKQEEK